MGVPSDRLRPVNRYETKNKSEVSFGFDWGVAQVAYRELLEGCRGGALVGATFEAFLLAVKPIRKFQAKTVKHFIIQVKRLARLLHGNNPQF